MPSFVGFPELIIFVLTPVLTFLFLVTAVRIGVRLAYRDLAAKCPHCRQRTAPGARFCGSCGTALAPAATPAPGRR